MFRIGIFLLSVIVWRPTKQSFVHHAAFQSVILTNNDKRKKVPQIAGLSIFKQLKDYFFFSFFSILAFKPARISLLSPRVAAGAFEAEATASATALTAFSSSSRKIAV